MKISSSLAFAATVTMQPVWTPEKSRAKAAASASEDSVTR